MRIDDAVAIVVHAVARLFGPLAREPQRLSFDPGFIDGPAPGGTDIGVLDVPGFDRRLRIIGAVGRFEHHYQSH